jgi:hypothetical protein
MYCSSVRFGFSVHIIGFDCYGIPVYNRLELATLSALPLGGSLSAGTDHLNWAHACSFKRKGRGITRSRTEALGGNFKKRRTKRAEQTIARGVFVAPFEGRNQALAIGCNT